MARLEKEIMSERILTSKTKMNLSGSKFPVLQEITYSELIETVVSNKGSQCNSADVIEELNALIKIRNRESINICNNTMKYIIEEVRKYE